MSRPLLSDSSSSSSNSSKSVWSSELPLVFSQGQPRSLESLNLRELQRFLTFVLCCERGLNPDCSSSQNGEVSPDWPLERPQWWPKDVAFNKEQILNAQGKKGYWCSCLRKVLRCCYDHHNTSYLLEFSGRLMMYLRSVDTCTYIDNGDGTKTLKNTKNGKLLVTFRAENQSYDEGGSEEWETGTTMELNATAPQPQTSSPLLRRRSSSSASKAISINSPLKLGPTSSPKKNYSDPVLPAFPDVYLCDTCDRDFESFNALLTHESLCRFSEPALSDQVDKGPFLTYFRLRDVNSDRPRTTPFRESYSTRSGSSGVSQAPQVKRPKTGSYSKFLTIDLSSPLGSYILRNKKVNAELIDVANLCESARREARSSLRVNDFAVTCPKRHRRRNQHFHTYCFSPYQRWKRQVALDTGLNPVSLRLLQECSKTTWEIPVKRWEDEMRDRKRKRARLLQEQLRQQQEQQQINLS